MEEKPGKDPAYPAEYAHVEQLIKDTQEAVRQMDERIKNPPSDRGPGPHYSPPGFLRSRQPGDRAVGVDKLVAAKDTLKTERFNQVEKATQQASPEDRAQVRNQAREALFPNPYRNKTAAERDAQHGERRDLEQSQDYADALRFPPAPEPTAPGSELDQSQERMNAMLDHVRKAEPDVAPTNSSASARFTQTLHWSPSADKSEGPSTPTRYRDVERDRD